MRVTEKSVTEEQIRKLRREAIEAGDAMQCAICGRALGSTDREYDYTTLTDAEGRRFNALTQADAVKLVVEALNEND